MLGATLKQRRIAAGLSQQQLADRAGISRPFLSRLERGEYLQPSPDVLIGLAAALPNIREYDLFAAAGYALPEQLPDFMTYFCTKYPELPHAAITELRDYYQLVRHKYGLTDVPSDIEKN